MGESVWFLNGLRYISLILLAGYTYLNELR